ncbi:MAG: excisionase family DNA-binding protein [Clostridium sp.]|uniref:excisionase family DNA-binding protein n=1 Tax=Clostridium sp. TaxID=1506 RepID=UPI00290303F4|nr:excisionase family DNA-binding protein [Clostridium sp.]MDU1311697.1 excisionase family DNA-binding protein [Clostridium sp.]MDU1408848.1 excisionase family DNA-binding protein [Clostridium sp.]
MKEIISLLNKILHSLEKQSVEKITFTPAEAATYMGVGHEKVRELIEKHETDFPYFKSGCKARIDKGLLDLWIKKISEEHRAI